MIETQGITKSYASTTVLSDVSLRIHRGECVVLLGPSGAGKSTALRCLAGLEELQAGSVVFQGETFVTPEGTHRHLRGAIGMVFQQFNLFPHLSVLDNVALAPRRVKKVALPQARRQAEELLDLVGLGNRRGYFPHELSGGQQQRVAIARALAMEPTLMLFDEPTSSLDPEHTREVLRVMRQVIDLGMTVAVVTHEMSFARQSADRVLFMDEGRVVEDAPAARFFTAPQSARARAFLREEDE
ncbi:ATP-binding cassette domain-containing protein [Auraticoccus sp. F435]|uniref:ATP-binding cassette domain-containing protein n=1 Tax=Auraticoccus cholistanensis TaxID=2656650 RepID=A0A6A9V287_9ACTN|nr:ATP-binding cassette domain-containing protein [Auraticoccus cholistanensis]